MSTPCVQSLELNRSIFNEIASKWSLLILGCLCDGPQRFNALRRANSCITQKSLTQCLRRLEANGLIVRSVISIAPVAVVYEISPLGWSLAPHLRAILQWSEDNFAEVMAAQKAFSAQDKPTQN